MFPTRLAEACQSLFARLTLAYLAGSLCLVASGLANLKYGLALGSNDLERTIAGAASVGADLWNAAGLVVAAWAFRRKLWGEAVAASLVLAITLIYSVNAGIGFAATTKAEYVGKREATVRADRSVENRLTGIDKRLGELGSLEPAATYKSQMEAILADRRAGECKVLNGPYTKEHCPRYFALSATYAKAAERERLVAERDGLAGKLETTETVAEADPLNEAIVTYLSTLGFHPTVDGIRPWQTLVFVLLVVIGGPVMIWAAESKIERTRPKIRAAANQNRLEPDPEIEETGTGLIVRPRRVVSLTPTAQGALTRLHEMGGAVERKSQSEIADVLQIPRTSYRRIVDRLESSDLIRVQHLGKKGYRVSIAA